MFRLLTTVGLAVGALGATAASHHLPSAELRGEALMHALRQGGYTIMLRHARTDRSFNEPREYVPTLRTQQRNLNDAGVADARLMGVVFKKYQIPIGEIISSPMFRTTETAEYAAGVPTTTMALRVFPATAEQAALVAKAPKAGTNRLVVTHHFVIETHVPGITPGDINESEAAVIRHLPDGKVELVGRILLADWQALGGTPTAGGDAHHPGGVPAAVHQVVPGVHAPTVAFPETVVGRLAQRYIEAFNSGDVARMTAFIESSLVVNPDRPTAVRVQGYEGLFATHGALIVGAITNADATQVVVSTRSKQGNVLVTARLADQQPDRLASVTFAIGGGHP